LASGSPVKELWARMKVVGRILLALGHLSQKVNKSKTWPSQKENHENTFAHEIRKTERDRKQQVIHSMEKNGNNSL
jgi:hypothetical protein